MAANKFATLLHRNTHSIAVVLVYALLEWILILLLLLNGVFSYLISKYASFFGLKPPCVMCSRVDHLFEPDGGPGRRRSFRHLLCDAHAVELSLLGYCTHHRKLADAGDMCEDCASSRPTGGGVLSWMNRSEMGENDLRCSCCHVALESGFYSSFFLSKPSWDILECAQKGNSVDESREDGKMVALGVGDTDKGHEGEVEKIEDERTDNEGEQSSLIPRTEQEEKPLVSIRDNSVDTTARQVEKELDVERLLSLDSIVHKGAWPLDIGFVLEEKKAVLSLDGEHIVGCSSDHEILVLPATQLGLGGGVDAHLGAPGAVEEIAATQAAEDDHKSIDLDANCEISIRSETSEQEQADQAQFTEVVPLPFDQEVMDNDRGVISDLPMFAGLDAAAEASRGFPGLPTSEEVKLEDVGSNYKTLEPDKIKRERFREQISISLDADHEQISVSLAVQAETTEAVLPSLNLPSPEHHETEDKRTPETPTRRFMCERRESGTESLDGSVASEVEACDPPTIDQLKSALRAERKALNALYAELEEERSASAVAANQTMAMISRLQEEKSAMQMEALQYQRMMEEQTEYDQEAMQLLNELVMKREKENQDLEKELELYRQKFLRFEAKVRRRIDGSPSASSSAEDIDDLSSDYGEHDESVHDLYGSILEKSLVDFEEERLSILEELKSLENRLFALEDDEPDNGNVAHENYHGNGNGFSEDWNGHELDLEGRIVGLRGKRLLPLFDSVSLENSDGLSTKQEADENGGSMQSLSNDMKDRDKLRIAEDVALVHERLQALEEDREFFKHCIKSSKKGDKGLGLLQEILQHLRDLRRVEMRARNTGDSLASL